MPLPTRLDIAHRDGLEFELERHGGRPSFKFQVAARLSRTDSGSESRRTFESSDTCKRGILTRALHVISTDLLFADPQLTLASAGPSCDAQSKLKKILLRISTKMVEDNISRNVVLPVAPVPTITNSAAFRRRLSSFVLGKGLISSTTNVIKKIAEENTLSSQCDATSTVPCSDRISSK